MLMYQQLWEHYIGEAERHQNKEVTTKFTLEEVVEKIWQPTEKHFQNLNQEIRKLEKEWPTDDSYPDVVVKHILRSSIFAQYIAYGCKLMHFFLSLNYMPTSVKCYHFSLIWTF